MTSAATVFSKIGKALSFMSEDVHYLRYLRAEKLPQIKMYILYFLHLIYDNAIQLMSN